MQYYFPKSSIQFSLVIFGLFFACTFTQAQTQEKEYVLYDTATVKTLYKQAEKFEDEGINQSAIARYKQVFELLDKEKTPHAYAVNLFKIGSLYTNSTKLDSAFILLNDAKSILYNLEAPTPYWIQGTHYSLGLAYSRFGNYAEAIKEFRGGLKSETKEKGEKYPSKFLTELGRVEARIGNFEKSIEYLKRAEIGMLAIHGEDSYNYLVTLIDLGSSYNYASNFTEAKIYLEKAQPLVEKYKSGEKLKDYLYRNMGWCYAESGEIESAKEAFKKTLEFNINRFGEGHYLVAIEYNNLAKFYFMNRQNEEDKALALEYAQKALEIRKTVLGEKNDEVSESYANLSTFFNEFNEYDKAAKNIQQALIAASDDFNDTDFSKNPTIESFSNKLFAKRLLNDKAKMCITAYKGTNDKKWLEMGATPAKLANELFMILFKKFDSWENSKLILSNRSDDTEFVITSLLHDLTGDPAYGETMFQLAENKKSFLLKQALLENHEKKELLLPNELISKETELANNIIDFEQNLWEAENAKNDSLITKYRDKVFFTKSEYEALSKDVKQRFPTYFDVKYDNQVAETSKIRTLIDDETLIVSFVIFQSDHQQKLYLISLSKNAPLQTQEVDIDAESFASIERFSQLLQSPTLFRKTKREEFIQLSNELYQQFIQPIENQLIDKKKLVVIGDGVTHYLPFEALLKSNEIKPFHELNYLVNDYEISYHYSATLFAKSREDKREIPEGLLAFAPVFDDKDDTNAFASRNRTTIDTTYRAIDREGNFTPLKYSLVEVNTIAEMVKKQSNQTTKVLLFEEANEVTLKQNIEQPYRFVHIASHSFANLKDTKFSGIACTPPQNLTAKEDGILYLGEIYNMQVPADLVVLSSCESGLGKLQSGEGLIGLNRSFIYAGVPNVIFSLWKVNDKASSDLMIDFYRETLAGDDYAAALRKAKIKMIQNENTASPNLWSSFLLIGR